MIELRGIAIWLGQRQLVDLNLSVGAGQYAVLMGRTGCGKTSLLETICGLRPAAAGSVWLAGQDVTDWSPARRAVGYVPQDMALFTTMTVRRNLGYSLELRKAEPQQVRERTETLAQLLGIEALLERTPRGLSGGEARRVALGRALAFEPRVLLLDEPLTGLDETTRDAMYVLLREVRARTGVTVLHVTHSRSDVEALADRRFELVDDQLQETSC
jgi:molybdate transport system ATP-binding protein/molybdate/tungstate transport system ATP-binding protein